MVLSKRHNKVRRKSQGKDRKVPNRQLKRVRKAREKLKVRKLLGVLRPQMVKEKRQVQNQEAQRLPCSSKVQKDLKVARVKNPVPVIKFLHKWPARVGIRVRVILLKVPEVPCRNKQGKSRVIAKVVKEEHKAVLI